ncbi:hypothetical protein VB_PLAS3A_45 [Paenibacillus phage vB_PlaS-3/A]|uniref:Uncharacterized protein n=11 Tax=root TaxID=1 RepID=A0A0K2CYG6_9CAUD|nr:hypothetical protein XENIA_50 [Paenibacillus phage Xenia]YP_009836375.1 hypothetical protein HWB44_gp45 [Paenibacillus phage PBL1c]YP_009836592.1 hypothetical protein HWB47_gp48 [Paenibacillus phage Leyra]YP_009838808.1 hypothetical protein HWB72_gp37 [Paenibacillus phage Lucielle]AUS03660.1 hypothetical protein KIEL007_39 [Paenibacillus phage Kiel007]AXF40477.1 hypothetical protein SAUDAGE_37 [Paenibacillus phage Saudage]UYL93461.1 hypothetical protein VB_PLAS1A_46 [Paenibacillus phage vB
MKKMNQKQQQGIAAQEWTVVIVDGYNIQQSIVDEKDRDSKKSQLQLELTFYSNDLSAVKFEDFLQDLQEFIKERNRRYKELARKRSEINQ